MRRPYIYPALEQRYCMLTNNVFVLECQNFPTAIARGGTEFRSQVFLGASVHGYIFIGYTYLVKIHNADLKAIVMSAIFGCMTLILPASRKLPDITMSGIGSNFQPNSP